MDMSIFDNITNHPTLVCNSVKTALELEILEDFIYIKWSLFGQEFKNYG